MDAESDQLLNLGNEPLSVALDFEFSKSQIFTIFSICLVMFHLCVIGHEILGHGIMGCMAMGFRPEIFTSAFIHCSNDTTPFGWMAAAGTIENLSIGTLF